MGKDKKNIFFATIIAHFKKSYIFTPQINLVTSDGLTNIPLR